ncbi:MAG: YdcF family protein, partial [Chloroflexota bacterium]|nr:YdcF family protein [Chloroflexota bacterium]
MRFVVGFVTGIAATLAVLMSVGHFLAVEDPLRQADAIVAISGDQGARTATAVALWKQGLAPVIVFAGSSEDPASLPSAEIMKREAVRLGLPADRVLTEPSSATTLENATRVVELLRAHQIKSAILV